MSDYFFLVKVCEEVESEMVVTSRASNSRRSATPSGRDFKIGFYRQLPDAVTWSLLDVRQFGASGFLSVTSSEFGLSSGDLVVGVPMAGGHVFQDDVHSLPQPYSRKLENTPSNERCTVRFRYKGSRTSYQGEYPFGMAQRSRGSLVSFCSMLSGFSMARTTAVMVNIVTSPLENKPDHVLQLSDCETKQKLKQVHYKNNSAAILEFDNTVSRPCVLTSGSTLGIPIYVSRSQGNELPQISVEHSHPPSEFFFGETKNASQAVLKAKWLSNIYRPEVS